MKAIPCTLIALLCVGCVVTVEKILLRRHPAFVDTPTIAQTAVGDPGDALNVALIGTEEQLLRALRSAGWHAADTVTLRSSLRIGLDTVFRRPYADAPVSNLFVWARKEDLAFEQPVGPDPRRRHHVRFWRSGQVDELGRPLWLGAATYDTGIGLSHRNGHITHHISPDIDGERDKLMGDLRSANFLTEAVWVEGFQPAASGRNGGGDTWRTDRRLALGIIAEPGKTVATPAQNL